MGIDPKVFVISGPSGAGKGTLTELLLKRVPSLTRSISVTTRNPRPGEVCGVDYFFVTREEFEKHIEKGDFLEYAQVHGNYYGTLRSMVENELKIGNDIVLVIDVQGGASIKQKAPDAVLIFIEPPSMAELIGRLRVRNTETQAELEHRLKNAEAEMRLAKMYDYVVINDEIERAADELIHIVQQERQKNKGEGDN
ncbi:MAG TPA: guanylate kinase [Candidatus Aquicultor sp.]|jgi:guanylate kinase